MKSRYYTIFQYKGDFLSWHKRFGEDLIVGTVLDSVVVENEINWKVLEGQSSSDGKIEGFISPGKHTDRLITSCYSSPTGNIWHFQSTSAERNNWGDAAPL